MGPLKKMLGLIDIAARAEFKAENMFKDKVYTPEQQDLLDFYEPACRVWCKNNGKNPDAMCDVMTEGSGLSGLPELYRVPTWHMVVDMMHECYRAIGEATATYQAAMAAQEAMGLTSETESSPAAGAEPAVH